IEALDRLAIGGDAGERLGHLGLAAIEHFLQHLGQGKGLQRIAGAALARAKFPNRLRHDLLPAARAILAWRGAAGSAALGRSAGKTKPAPPPAFLEGATPVADAIDQIASSQIA